MEDSLVVSYSLFRALHRMPARKATSTNERKRLKREDKGRQGMGKKRAGREEGIETASILRILQTPLVNYKRLVQSCYTKATNQSFSRSIRIITYQSIKSLCVHAYIEPRACNQQN